MNQSRAGARAFMASGSPAYTFEWRQLVAVGAESLNLSSTLKLGVPELSADSASSYRQPGEAGGRASAPDHAGSRDELPQKRTEHAAIPISPSAFLIVGGSAPSGPLNDLWLAELLAPTGVPPSPTGNAPPSVVLSKLASGELDEGLPVIRGLAMRLSQKGATGDRAGLSQSRALAPRNNAPFSARHAMASTLFQSGTVGTGTLDYLRQAAGLTSKHMYVCRSGLVRIDEGLVLPGSLPPNEAAARSPSGASDRVFNASYTDLFIFGGTTTENATNDLYHLRIVSADPDPNQFSVDKLYRPIGSFQSTAVGSMGTLGAAEAAEALGANGPRNGLSPRRQEETFTLATSFHDEQELGVSLRVSLGVGTEEAAPSRKDAEVDASRVDGVQPGPLPEPEPKPLAVAELEPPAPTSSEPSQELLGAIHKQVQSACEAEVANACEQAKGTLAKELHKELHDELWKELHDGLHTELYNELHEKLQQELYGKLHDPLCGELQANLQANSREVSEQMSRDRRGLYGELHDALDKEIYDKLHQELTGSFREGLKTSPKSELHDSLQEELCSDAHSHIQTKLQDEFCQKLQADIKRELRNELQNELQTTLSTKLAELSKFNKQLQAQLQELQALEAQREQREQREQQEAHEIHEIQEPREPQEVQEAPPTTQPKEDSVPGPAPVDVQQLREDISQGIKRELSSELSKALGDQLNRGFSEQRELLTKQLKGGITSSLRAQLQEDAKQAAAEAATTAAANAAANAASETMKREVKTAVDSAVKDAVEGAVQSAVQNAMEGVVSDVADSNAKAELESGLSSLEERLKERLDTLQGDITELQARLNRIQDVQKVQEAQAAQNEPEAPEVPDESDESDESEEPEVPRLSGELPDEEREKIISAVLQQVGERMLASLNIPITLPAGPQDEGEAGNDSMLPPEVGTRSLGRSGLQAELQEGFQEERQPQHQNFQDFHEFQGMESATPAASAEPQEPLGSAESAESTESAFLELRKRITFDLEQTLHARLAETLQPPDGVFPEAPDHGETADSASVDQFEDTRALSSDDLLADHYSIIDLTSMLHDVVGRVVTVEERVDVLDQKNEGLDDLLATLAEDSASSSVLQKIQKHVSGLKIQTTILRRRLRGLEEYVTAGSVAKRSELEMEVAKLTEKEEAEETERAEREKGREARRISDPRALLESPKAQEHLTAHGARDAYDDQGNPMSPASPRSPRSPKDHPLPGKTSPALKNSQDTGDSQELPGNPVTEIPPEGIQEESPGRHDPEDSQESVDLGELLTASQVIDADAPEDVQADTNDLKDLLSKIGKMDRDLCDLENKHKLPSRSTTPVLERAIRGIHRD